MSCLGVLFSLDEKEVEKLKSYDADSERLEYLQHSIEEIYFEKFPDRIAELDKSWDGLHRSLTDGKYGWDWFSNSIAFWELAAKENRYVLFTADQ